MPLKEFISAYTAKKGKKDIGKGERVAFNDKPADALKKYGVATEDLRALLSFKEPTISEQVLQDMLDNAWSEKSAKDFSKWLLAFAKWTWPPGGEKDYKQPLCDAMGAALQPAYGTPQCHLKSVTANIRGASAQPGKTQVELKVVGEGFLPGATIECVNIATNDVVRAGPASFDAQSTFRCSLLTATVDLTPGDYRARVQDDLGASGQYTIDRDANGNLPAKFTVV